MSNINGLIPVEVATQLQQFSKLAHQDNKSSGDIENLNEIGNKTLAAIDAEIDNVSIISKNYLEILSNLIGSAIKSGDWNELPTVSKVRADLQQIKSTIVAIGESMQFFPVDIEKIMSEIIKVQAEVMQSYANQKAVAKRLQIKLNESEIANKKSANLKELQGALISASLKVVSGALQMVSGGFNAKSAGKSLVDSKNALAMSQDLTGFKLKGIEAKTRIDKNDESIKGFNIEKNKLIEANKSSSLDEATKKSNKKKIAEIESNVHKMEASDNATGKLSSYEAKSVLKQNNVLNQDMQNKIDALNNNARARTEVTAGRTAAINSLGGVGVALADGAAAVMKSQAGSDEINAEVDRQASAMAGVVEQGYLDSYQQIRNAITDMIQRLSAIYQVLGSSESAQSKV